MTTRPAHLMRPLHPTLTPRPHGFPTTATSVHSGNRGRCGGCGVARGKARTKEVCRDDVVRVRVHRETPQRPRPPRRAVLKRIDELSPPHAEPTRHPTTLDRPSLIGVDDREARAFILRRRYRLRASLVSLRSTFAPTRPPRSARRKFAVIADEEDVTIAVNVGYARPLRMIAAYTALGTCAANW